MVMGGVWFLLRYWGTVRRAWKEPMLRVPVLLIESDDWGPPGAGQAAALSRLGGALRRFRDCEGRPAQMTLGMVLAAPRAAVEPVGWDTADALVTVESPEYSNLRKTLAEYADCFSPQLHGWMHCHPEAVARAAARDSGVAALAARVAEAGYQVLPRELQSRWADCSRLPCRPVTGAVARREATREALWFREKVPGAAPVAVPPTFVWNADVEKGWAKGGIRCLVTCGRRHTSRDADGEPAGIDRIFHNGECLPSGLRVLVRDVYFEPALGHTVDEALSLIQEHWRLGRPALIESHRFNFEGSHADSGIALLVELLEAVVRVAPGVCFLRSMVLLEYLDDPRMLVRGRARLGIWARRLWTDRGLRRALLMSGALVWLLAAWLLSLGTERSRP